MKKLTKLALALAAVAMMAAPAYAGQDTDNMTVQVNVIAACAIGTVGTLDFGTIRDDEVADTDSSATFDVTCSSGQAYNIDLGNGSNFGGTRNMINSGELLGYDLYTDATYGTIWDNGTRGSSVGSSGTGGAQVFTVYGRIPGPVALTNTGLYSDTVVVTLTY